MDFVKMADNHIKDMDKQIAEARKACAPKPWIEKTTMKLWIQRLILVLFVSGIVLNEIWPRLKTQFKL